jgi:hypothetical protein
MDLHHFGNHPDPHPHQIKIRIRIRIKISINLQMTSQTVWNMSLFEHFFKGLSLGSGSGFGTASGWKVGSGSASASNKNPDLDPLQEFGSASTWCGSTTLPVMVTVTMTVERSMPDFIIFISATHSWTTGIGSMQTPEQSKKFQTPAA